MPAITAVEVARSATVLRDQPEGLMTLDDEAVVREDVLPGERADQVRDEERAR